MNPAGTLPQVDSAINYVERTTVETVTFPFQSGNQAKLPREAHAVTITDLRPVAAQVTPESHGFALHRHKTQAIDFNKESELRCHYFPEIERLVQDVTGAVKVVAFHGVRRHEGGGALPAVRLAHIDYTPDCYRRWAEALLPPAEARRLLRGRLLSFNVWRPLKPVEMAPLAVCAGDSVAPDDLKTIKIVGPSEPESMKEREGYHLMFNPAHRWFYFSAMQPDEVLLIKQHDTRDVACPRSPPAAFDDPTSRPDAPARESYEVRTLVFLG